MEKALQENINVKNQGIGSEIKDAKCVSKQCEYKKQLDKLDVDGIRNSDKIDNKPDPIPSPCTRARVVRQKILIKHSGEFDANKRPQADLFLQIKRGGE